MTITKHNSEILQEKHPVLIDRKSETNFKSRINKQSNGRRQLTISGKRRYSKMGFYGKHE